MLRDRVELGLNRCCSVSSEAYRKCEKQCLLQVSNLMYPHLYVNKGIQSLFEWACCNYFSIHKGNSEALS